MTRFWSEVVWWKHVEDGTDQGPTRRDARDFEGARSADEMLAGLAALPAERYGHAPMLGRIWELGTDFTCYDTVYIALPELTDATLYTCDTKMRKIHRAEVVVFGA